MLKTVTEIAITNKISSIARTDDGKYIVEYGTDRLDVESPITAFNDDHIAYDKKYSYLREMTTLPDYISKEVTSSQETNNGLIIGTGDTYYIIYDLLYDDDDISVSPTNIITYNGEDNIFNYSEINWYTSNNAIYFESTNIYKDSDCYTHFIFPTYISGVSLDDNGFYKSTSDTTDQTALYFRYRKGIEIESDSIINIVAYRYSENTSYITYNGLPANTKTLISLDPTSISKITISSTASSGTIWVK